MPNTEQIAMTTEPSHANGGSTMHELFALTDEQILEIEPEAQDVEISDRQPSTHAEGNFAVAPASLPAGSEAAAAATENRRLEAGATTAAQNLNAAQPPEWLAQRMSDPWNGQDAREFWQGVQKERQDAAAYREVFAKPEDARALKELYPGGVDEARTAAQRARVLDDIDRAYFAGDTNQRAQLAAMMLREDPAAFREMVFEGLRALEKVGVAATPSGSSSSSVAGSQRAIENAATAAQREQSAAPPTQSAHASSTNNREAEFAAYAAFEKAANEDLERSVGATIERTLAQVLPNLSKNDSSSVVGAQHAAPLQARLTAAVRQDVEAALKNDRQLGEQVVQILSGRRLDSETRAQVVRLIGERAAQLVPGAAKRALNDWTQTTLAAHGARSGRTEATSTRREVATASAAHGPQREQQARNQRQETRGQNARSSTAGNSRRVDYGKLSDEQILEL